MSYLFYVMLGLISFFFYRSRGFIKNWAVMAYRAYFALQPIPGPKNYPLIGCALEIKWDSVEFSFQLEEWARTYLIDAPETIGMLKGWLGPVPLIFILRARHVKVVLESSTLITKPPQYDILSDWIGTGLLTSTNEKWYSRRKLLTPTFHFNVLKGYNEVFKNQGRILVEQLESKADTGREFDIFPYIKRCALDIICETAMGTSLNTQTGGNAYYVDAVVRVSDLIWSYQRFPWLWVKPIWYGLGYGFEFDRLVKLTNDFTRSVIQDRRKVLEEDGTLGQDAVKNEQEVKKQKVVFLDMLLMMQKVNALSDEDIREEVDTFMFEGHDTTGSAMGFTIWFLGQFVEDQEKVHKEMDSIFGDDKIRDPTEDDLRKMVYLERCIKETLRMSYLFYVMLGLISFFFYRSRGFIKNWAVMAYRAYFALQPIPGPKNYPLIGCALEIKWDSVEFSFQLEEWARTYLIDAPETIGMLKGWLGPVPLIFILRARHVKVVLESSTLITKPPQYDILSDWIGTGLLTSTNEKWYSRRKLLTPTFHFNVLKGYNEVFKNQGRILVEQLESKADTGREFDIFPYIKRCALDIICETAMGTSLNTQTGGNAYYVDAVVRVSDLIWSYQRFPWLWVKPIWYGLGYGFEFDRLVKLTNDFTRSVIQDRRKVLEEDGTLGQDAVKNEQEVKKQKVVFLDMLLMMQKVNALSDEDIREEVDTFMFEGHDTTGSAMGFTIWFLGQFVEDQEKVHKEMDSIFGDDKIRDPTEDDLRKMVYLERCIKETLRWTPSVPFIGRVLSHDAHFEPENITLPKGMTVAFSPVATHRDPEHWEQNEGFYPDHFLPEKVANRHPYAYIPFSAGPRNCIGQKFAIAEEKTVLSWFFRRYRVETVEPFPGNRPVPEVILKPPNGFGVRIFKRT